MKRYSLIHLAILLALALLLTPAQPARAWASFYVNTTADTVDINPGNGICQDSSSTCSLRAAIMEANALGGSSAHWIFLGSNKTHTLSLDPDGNGHVTDGGASTDDLDITANILIYGNFATIRRTGVTCNINNSAATGEFRIFEVHSGGKLALRDVTVRDGCADGGVENGGGIAVAGGGELTVINSTLANHRANNRGGGIYSNGTVTIENSTIAANSAGDGGGMYNDLSSTTLTNVIFSTNSATYYGGGMRNDNSHPMLTNVTFSGNSAGLTGGGMVNSYSSPKLINVLFSGNSAQIGGGMINDNQSNPTLTNVTFSRNSAGSNSGGGGMLNVNQSKPTLVNVIIWGNNGGSLIVIDSNNPPAIFYSDIEGCTLYVCLNPYNHNINQDPLFVDADGADDIAGTLDDNLRLKPGSPAINAGSNSAVPSGVTTDLKGYPRIVNGSVDMGAYEAQLISPLYAAPAPLGKGNCSSWADACTLADALAFAMSGEQVWVKAGVHYPAVTTSESRRATFTLKNGVEVYGGFAGTPGTEGNFSVRDWRSNLTILSGDIDRNDTDVNGNGIIERWLGDNLKDDNAYHVVTGNGTDSSAVLDGFFITAGWANGSSPHNFGGGMFNEFGSPTLRNLIFSGNSAFKGGGIYNYQSSPVLATVAFHSNIADNNGDGGGMYNDRSSPKLTNAIFSGNSASNNGGGMYNHYYSSPELINVIFSGNAANSFGGGIYNYKSHPTLTNVTFSGNSAPTNPTNRGGAMLNYDYSNPTLTNAILWGNSGGEIVNLLSSNPNVSYSNIQGGYGGTGNISDDPLFIDPNGTDNIVGTPDDNLRLGFGSPAIDAGNNSAPGLSGITTDLDGKPRFVDIPTVPNTGNGTPPVDIGAYEAQDTIAPGVTVNQASTQADPTNSSPVLFIAVFSEPINTATFTPWDVSLVGSTAPGASVLSVTQIAPNDGTTFQITVGGMTGSGTVVVSITAGVAQDPAGNGNLASTSTDNSVIYDITAPTVVSITRADPNPTNAASVHFTVNFSEAVTGVDGGDFSPTTTGSIAGASVTGVSGSGSTYTVTVSTGTGSGTLRLDVPGTATITDPAGNGLSGLPYTDGEVYTILIRLFLPLVLR